MGSSPISLNDEPPLMQMPQRVHGSHCSCKRAGLRCSIICVACKGTSFTNSDVSIDEEECVDLIDEMLNNLLNLDLDTSSANI